MGFRFADIPDGLGGVSEVPAAGWAQIVAYGAFCEVSQARSAGTSAAVGGLGLKMVTSSDVVREESKLAAEIVDGRLALIAIGTAELRILATNG